jgi:hypothetical protein
VYITHQKRWRHQQSLYQSESFHSVEATPSEPDLLTPL